MILIYITYPNKEEAKKIVKHLLKKKLIACANIFPVESFYHWKGKMKSGKEFVSLLKASDANWERIQEEVKQLHSYGVPCIIKINAEANAEFEEWVEAESQD